MPLIRPLGLEKNPKLINVGSTLIPDYRVNPKLIVATIFAGTREQYVATVNFGYVVNHFEGI